MKLHLGCGKRDFGPGWYHIDGADFLHVKEHDITLQNFGANKAEVIYASHLLEYFDRQGGFLLLTLWYEALEHGGVLRLAVPDFDNMMLALHRYEFTLDDILGPLYGKMEMGDQTIYHKTVYNYDHLKALLMRVGFKNVRRYNWRDTEHAHIDDQSQAYLPKMDKEHGILISLNVEATK